MFDKIYIPFSMNIMDIYVFLFIHGCYIIHFIKKVKFKINKKYDIIHNFTLNIFFFFSIK